MANATKYYPTWISSDWLRRYPDTKFSRSWKGTVVYTLPPLAGEGRYYVFEDAVTLANCADLRVTYFKAPQFAQPCSLEEAARQMALADPAHPDSDDAPTPATLTPASWQARRVGCICDFPAEISDTTPNGCDFSRSFSKPPAIHPDCPVHVRSMHPSQVPGDILMGKPSKETSAKITSRDVLSAIFARHQGPEWVSFAEVADSTGTLARRRADAICMNIWPSKGFVIHGFEIKVTRSDFLQEMKDITKSAAVAKYCDFWWLAAPVGLVSVDELPSNWGLLELQKNGLRLKKQAPQKENPADLNRRFMASLLRCSRQADDLYIRGQIEKGCADRKVQLEEEKERLKTRRDFQQEKNAAWIAEFEERLGVSFPKWSSPEAFVERMKLAEALEAHGRINSLLTSCNTVAQDISALREALGLADLSDPPDSPTNQHKGGADAR